MLGKWIEKQEGLPDGILIVDEKLGRILKMIHGLENQDLQELEAFAGYLAGGSESLENKAASKMYDFMTGGMQRAI
jgi:hypothetical protein